VTYAALRANVLERLGEDAAVSGYYDGVDAGDGLNRAQRLFVLLTLCLEATGSITISPATAWYQVRTQIPGWMLPLTLEFDGAKLRPVRLAELDALAVGWQATPGDPERYALLGLALLAIYKQAPEAGTLGTTYAKPPAWMIDDADVPEIPAAYHELLPDAAIALLRLREGGQELEKVKPLLGRFMTGATQLARYVRERSLDLRYDRQPAELERFDLSRLLAISKRRDPWLITSDTRPEPAQT